MDVFSLKPATDDAAQLPHKSFNHLHWTTPELLRKAVYGM